MSERPSTQTNWRPLNVREKAENGAGPDPVSGPSWPARSVNDRRDHATLSVEVRKTPPPREMKAMNPVSHPSFNFCTKRFHGQSSVAVRLLQAATVAGRREAELSAMKCVSHHSRLKSDQINSRRLTRPAQCWSRMDWT